MLPAPECWGGVSATLTDYVRSIQDNMGSIEIGDFGEFMRKLGYRQGLLGVCTDARQAAENLVIVLKLCLVKPWGRMFGPL